MKLGLLTWYLTSARLANIYKNLDTVCAWLLLPKNKFYLWMHYEKDWIIISSAVARRYLNLSTLYYYPYVLLRLHFELTQIFNSIFYSLFIRSIFKWDFLFTSLWFFSCNFKFLRLQYTFRSENLVLSNSFIVWFYLLFSYCNIPYAIFISFYLGFFPNK